MIINDVSILLLIYCMIFFDLYIFNISKYRIFCVLWNSVLLFLIIFVKLNECELNFSEKKIK